MRAAPPPTAVRSKHKTCRKEWRRLIPARGWSTRNVAKQAEEHTVQTGPGRATRSRQTPTVPWTARPEQTCTQADAKAAALQPAKSPPRHPVRAWRARHAQAPSSYRPGLPSRRPNRSPAAAGRPHARAGRAPGAARGAPHPPGLALGGQLGSLHRARRLVHDRLDLLHALQAAGHQRLHQPVVELLHFRRQVLQKPAARRAAAYAGRGAWPRAMPVRPGPGPPGAVLRSPARRPGGALAAAQLSCMNPAPGASGRRAPPGCFTQH